MGEVSSVAWSSGVLGSGGENNNTVGETRDDGRGEGAGGDGYGGWDT